MGLGRALSLSCTPICCLVTSNLYFLQVAVPAVCYLRDPFRQEVYYETFLLSQFTPAQQASSGAASGQESWRRLLHVLAVNGHTLGGSILHHGAAVSHPCCFDLYLQGSLPAEFRDGMIGRAPLSWDSHLARREASASSPIQLLPDHLLGVIIGQVESSADVEALSRTCSTLHSQLCGPTLMADCLWRWKDDHGLFWAASKAPPVLKQLIEVHHANVNVQDSHGVSLLATASQQQSDAEFSALSHLLAAPDIDVSDALHLVGVFYPPIPLKLLLSHPDVQVNAPNSEGFTVLDRCAVGHSCARLVRELLLHPDVNVNRANVQRGTPLQAACSRGAAAVVHELLQHPAIDVNSADAEYAEGRTALELAARGGHLECIKLLLQRNPYLNVYGALRTACESQHGAVAALLRQHVRMRRGGIFGFAARIWGV